MATFKLIFNPNNAVKYRGSCLCGKIKYSVLHASDSSYENLLPAQVLVCHCSLCRRQSGSLFVPFGAFPRQAVVFDELVQFDDKPKEYCAITTENEEETDEKNMDNTSRIIRKFCGNCGSFIGMDYEDEKDTIWFALGLFENFDFPAKDGGGDGKNLG